MFPRVGGKDSSCVFCTGHVERVGQVPQCIYRCEDDSKAEVLLFLRCDTFMSSCVEVFFLTVVHAKDDGGAKKGTNCLKEEVHGELPPALSAK